jgi:hypothetical protein
MRPDVPIWVFLPVSSSRCTRSMPTRNVLSPSEMSRYPSTHSGSSYCEIWKFFGMSG